MLLQDIYQKDIESVFSLRRSTVSNTLKLMEKIEIFPEEQEDGSIIKSVTFRFPLNINGEKLNQLALEGQTSEDRVETIVLLSQNGK